VRPTQRDHVRARLLGNADDVLAGCSNAQVHPIEVRSWTVASEEFARPALGLVLRLLAEERQRVFVVDVEDVDLDFRVPCERDGLRQGGGRYARPVERDEHAPELEGHRSVRRHEHERFADREEQVERDMAEQPRGISGREKYWPNGAWPSQTITGRLAWGSTMAIMAPSGGPLKTLMMAPSAAPRSR
jgi:hypothetical protein